jgi:hypothetical protein
MYAILADNFAARFSLRDFDLSRNKSLRTLEIAASYINDGSPDPLSRFLKHVVSTITSSSFFEIIILYHFWDECYWCSDPPPRTSSQPRLLEDIYQHHRRFEAFREAHKVRNFQLVLCANVWGRVGGQEVQVLENIVAGEKSRTGFDGFSSDPLVIYNPERGRITYDSFIPLSPL